jgi:hypothetical protein
VVGTCESGNELSVSETFGVFLVYVVTASALLNGVSSRIGFFPCVYNIDIRIYIRAN